MAVVVVIGIPPALSVPALRSLEQGENRSVGGVCQFSDPLLLDPLNLELAIVQSFFLLRQPIARLAVRNRPRHHPDIVVLVEVRAVFFRLVAAAPSIQSFRVFLEPERAFLDGTVQVTLGLRGLDRGPDVLARLQVIVEIGAGAPTFR